MSDDESTSPEINIEQETAYQKDPQFSLVRFTASKALLQTKNVFVKFDDDGKRVTMEKEFTKPGSKRSFQYPQQGLLVMSQLPPERRKDLLGKPKRSSAAVMAAAKQEQDEVEDKAAESDSEVKKPAKARVTNKDRLLVQLPSDEEDSPTPEVYVNQRDVALFIETWTSKKENEFWANHQTGAKPPSNATAFMNWYTIIDPTHLIKRCQSDIHEKPDEDKKSDPKVLARLRTKKANAEAVIKAIQACWIDREVQ